MQTKAATLGSTQGLRAPVQHRVSTRSRPVVMAAAHKGPHEGVMKAALAAAAAAQIFASNPAMALGNIKGVMPQRNRDEDTAARAAMDAAENKGPAVQDRTFSTADSPSGALKASDARPRASVGNTSTTSSFNEGVDKASGAFGRAKEAGKALAGGNLPTAFSFDTDSLQVNVGTPGSTSAEGGKQIGGGAPSAGGEKQAFNLQGPGSNQNRVAEIQNLNPAKAAKNAVTKAKNALPTANAFDTGSLQVNVGLLDKASSAVDSAKGVVGDAKSAVGDAAPTDLAGAASRKVSSAQEAAIGKLGEKAGSLTDGRLKDELENTKEKAPYIQGGPVRSTPDILNLDEPGKKIRSEASKLANKVTNTSAPAPWGDSLQVNVSYGTSKEVKDKAPDSSKINVDNITEKSRKGDAGGVSDDFGPGEQSVASGSKGTRPRSTETSDFRAGAADQSDAARFGAPTAAAKAISGQETV